uniref:Proline dehydrogenase n=1 Tax=Nannocystis pusilla TaxID=889268 RepID=A0A291FH13_9BACT|nr:proline dehydrogenase [Nannocystis pusilla]
MDFQWSDSQDELYRRALELAQRHFAGASRVWADHAFDRTHWDICAEFGLMGLCVPEAYGGLGLDALTTARVVEAFGRGCEDTGLVFSAAAHLFAAVMPIVEYGDEALKAALLPALARGAAIGANAITEGEAGSDAFALRTEARRDGEFYVLDGAKSYVSNGPVADEFVVYATMNRKHGYLGVTAFVVARDTPGLRLGEPLAKMGLKSSPACSLYLEGCRVPAARRLGREGQGGAVFQASMQWERSCLFAGYVGMLERQLAQAVEYARTRRQGGKPIGKHQAVAHRLAEMKLRLESARLLLYRACWLRDRGEPAVAEVSLAKLAISEAARLSSLDAIQIHGGIGFAADYNVEHMLRDSVPATLFSGTSEIQRDLIAREMGL